MGWTPLSDRLKSTVFSHVDCHRSISNGMSFTLLPTRHRRRAVNTFGARSRRTETEDREAPAKLFDRHAKSTLNKVNDANRGHELGTARSGTVSTGSGAGAGTNKFRYREIVGTHCQRSNQRGHEAARRGREHRPRRDGPRPIRLRPLARRRRAGQTKPTAAPSGNGSRTSARPV